ncbi:MAG: anti-sigma factor antagonist [Actinomycetota bacterium]|nr:anti-sigma factor antagonist [Actinomycetota bacterium]
MSVVRRPALRVSVADEGSTTVVALAGELDLATADVFRDHVKGLLGARTSPGRLVIDMGGLEFLDVTGLGAVLETRRKLVSKGGTIALRRPRPMVVRMLGLLDLETAFEVER